MGRVQIAFVGRNKEAAVNSITQFFEQKSDILIAVYSVESETVWNSIKDKANIFSKIEERKINFNNMQEVVSLIAEMTNRYKNMEKIINVTGLSKEGLLSILLFYALNSKEAYNTTISMLQKNKSVIFPPIIFFAMGCNDKKKQKILKSKILHELKKKEGLTITELSKRLRRTKSSISETVKLLEREKLIKKKRDGREVRIMLSEFAKFLIEIDKMRGDIK